MSLLRNDLAVVPPVRPSGHVTPFIQRSSSGLVVLNSEGDDVYRFGNLWQTHGIDEEIK